MDVIFLFFEKGSFTMLDFMRSSMKSFVMWLIIGAFVLTIFYAWGMKSARLGGGDENWIARVEDVIITTTEYEKELQQIEARFRELPPELLKSLNLKEQALNSLINRQVFMFITGEMGIEVGDREVAESIQSIPFFQENGVFSSRAYRASLAQNRATPASFELQQREALQIQKLQDIIQNSAKISDNEIHEAFVRQNERIVTEYALVSFEDQHPDAAPSEDDLAKYYQKHKENFRTLEEINVAFSFITPQSLFGEIEIPDEAVAKLYSDNQQLYIHPEIVHARHILVRVSKEADEETVKAAREKISKALEKANAGEDFAGLAQKYSEDSTASRGGDLGFFERGQMVESFERAAFALKPGKISPVVRTQFGYHIIKMEEREEEKTKALEEVRDEIIIELKTEQGMRLVRRKAMQVYAESRKGKDFRQALEEANLSVQETGYFSRKDSRINGVPMDLAPRFSEEAFAAGENGMGGIIKGSQGYILLKIQDRKLPRIPALEGVRTEVTEAVLEETAKGSAKKTAKKLAQSLQNKTPIAEAAEQAGIKDISTTKDFSRDETVVSPEFVKTAFTLSEENPAASMISDRGYYVLLLKEKKDLNEEGFQESSEELKKQLIQEKRDTLLASWMNRARKKLNIEINRELLER
jgi:peptidyl-prolyl cis-trans isomerase D